MFELTFPPLVRDFVKSKYDAASQILEYGSGGSTLYAVSKNKFTIAVESDVKWLRDLEAEINSLGHKTNFLPNYVNIGQTKEWGHPVDRTHFTNFPEYSISPWRRTIEPDLILIDGRFRVSCLLASAAFTKREATVLFDDYEDRPNYHYAEKLFPKRTVVGRMAEFVIYPGIVTARDILTNLSYFYDAA